MVGPGGSCGVASTTLQAWILEAPGWAVCCDRRSLGHILWCRIGGERDVRIEPPSHQSSPWVDTNLNPSIRRGDVERLRCLLARFTRQGWGVHGAGRHRNL